MADWISFDIPDAFLGDTHVSDSGYVRTYRTEVLLPKSSCYPGYCFLHPSKLIVKRANEIASITYNEAFTFTLIKKDREEGERYKRYKLTAAEIQAIYEPEMQKAKAKKERREQNRRAQVGSVEVVEYWISPQKRNLLILFHCKKKFFSGNGVCYGSEKDFTVRYVAAEGVVRGAFEDVFEELETLCREYQMVQDVRSVVSGGYDFCNGTVMEIRGFFEDLCGSLEAELYHKIDKIMNKAKLPDD